MSNPSATSSGDSMPDGLGLDAWWNEPAYKRCDSFSRRGVFILNHLLQRDPIKFVYVMYNPVPRCIDRRRGDYGLSVEDHPETYGRH